jgi:RNA polymerase sigma-70 factor (ECF subfamily)
VGFRGMGTTEKWTNSISPGEEQPDVLEARLGRAKLGDAEAFSEIYDRYAARIYSFAFRMVGSREDAEDITQDTFFLAFRNLKDLREQAHFEPWLYKIARNEIYKKRRKAKIKSDSLDEWDKGALYVLRSTDPAGDPEGKLLAAELGTRVKAIFDALPMRYKETLVLAVLQGLNYQKVSRILGRSLSAVKTDVYRARLLISEKIGKYSKR